MVKKLLPFIPFIFKLLKAIITTIIQIGLEKLERKPKDKPRDDKK